MYRVDPQPVAPIHEKPANVEYIQARIEDILNDEDPRLQKDSFDYVYSRYMILTTKDWPEYISSCSPFFKEGGLLEMHEGAHCVLYSADSPARPLDLQASTE